MQIPKIINAFNFSSVERAIALGSGPTHIQEEMEIKNYSQTEIMPKISQIKQNHENNFN